MLAGKRSTRLRDAVAVCCDECERVIATDCDPVPWGLNNTKGMHESGTGHRPYYLTWEEHAKLLLGAEEAT